jgi:hypothetical protein
MSKKKAFIPFAVIVSDEIPERFESAYASTLYETIPLLEGCNSDVKNLPAIYYLSRIIRSLNLGKINSKLFVIYNPNSQRLQMALFGDPDKLLLQVKNIADMNNLRQTYEAIDSFIQLYIAFQGYNLKAGDATRSRLFTSRIANKQVLKDMKNNAVNLKKTLDLMHPELTQNFLANFKFK